MITKTPNEPGQGSEDIPPPPMTHSKFCPFFLCLGWVFVGIGFVGAFVPGLPTTVFLIIALWAFSRSSDRLRMWLWTHPRFGSTLRDWHIHRVIPPSAKVTAVVFMMFSVAIVTVIASSWQAPVILATVLAPIAAWIITRRSFVPASAAHAK
ncbi:MAG: YbaN family protein [Rhodospirillaceae bacterium]